MHAQTVAFRNKGQHRRLARASAASALAMIIAFAVTAPTAAANLDAQHQFVIPAQPLDTALLAFSDQSKVQVLLWASSQPDAQSPGATGTLTALDALKALLQNTGLSYQQIDNDTVAIINPANPVNPGNSKAPTALQISRDGMDAQRDGTLRLARADTQGEQTRASANKPQVESKDTRDDIQEVIVTAQKREERLIDVPQSVQVLSTAELAKTGATRFYDYADSIPGLSFTTFGSGSRPIMRGITTGADSSATTAQYVDEVPYGTGSPRGGNYYMIDLALFDLDRIEVLKGPQGTLYGVSSLGGLIKYVTKRPNTDGFAGEAQLGMANTWSGSPSYNGAAAVNIPIMQDKMALRASAYYSREGGYLDNIPQHDDDIDWAEIKGGRLDLLFTPSDKFSIRLNALLQTLDRGGQPFADYTSTGKPLYGDLKQYRIYPETVDQKFYVFSNTMAYEFDWATLTSVTGLQQQNKYMTIDYTNYYTPIFGGLGRAYSEIGVAFWDHDRVFSQEVRLAASGNKRLEWVLGGFYTDEKNSYTDEFKLRDLAGNPAPNDLFNIYGPSSYTEYAGFGDLTWHFTDKFDMTGGVRYAHNEVTTATLGSGLFVSPQPRTGSSGKAVTYLGNARYKFNDRATGYLRYATGYRPGGPNFPEVDPTTGQLIGQPSFEADELKSYEIGFKGETANRFASIDIAAYHIDWTNIQVVIYPHGFGLQVNAPGGAVVNGVEMALGLNPTDRLSFTTVAAYTDAYMKEDSPEIGAAKDERLPTSPRFAGTFSTDYTFANDRFNPTVGASVRYVSDRTSGFVTPGFPPYVMPSYTTVNLHAGFKLQSVDLQFYLRNLLDERGQLTAFTFNGIQPLLTQPRTLGVTARMKF